MLFRKKAPEKGEDLRQRAARLFGPEVQVETDGSFLAEKDFPIVSGFAANAACDYAVRGEYRGWRFGLYFPLKVFRTERDRRISHWSFLGSCVRLQKERYPFPAAYALRGRPFRPPEKSLWVSNGKCGGLSLWSKERRLAPGELDGMERLIAWTDSEFAALWSSQYALLTESGLASIAFWEPELYDFEGQLKLFAEALERFPFTSAP